MNARSASTLAAALMALVLCIGCGGGSSTTASTGGSSLGSGTGTTTTTVNNLQPIQVSLGPAGNGVDELFTSVTVCVPGTSTCQTISDVLVDTGSSGLRILSSQITLALPAVTDGSGNPLGNCVTFADNSYIWGPVESAQVEMAGEVASPVPIQIVSPTSFPGAPPACNSGGVADNSVSTLGANGILGIGVFRQDCGAACAATGTQIPSVYFSCPSAGCAQTPTSVPLQNQLQNPVWLFPQDNNGVQISLPALPDAGASSVSGSLVFGIGTQSNNALIGAQIYTTDDLGNFSVVFNGNTYSASYLDTGSNGIFFLDASTLGIPDCPDGNSNFYCPSAEVSYGAITNGLNGASGQIAFSIANADVLFNTGNTAFSNLGGPMSGTFDLGLPFFFGRDVAVGIESQSSSYGTGPYWAF
jgi:hypothetical protein